jgi:hypothetical protein
VSFPWTTLLMIAAVAQLAGVAAWSAFSRTRFPQAGMRRSERVLIGSAAFALLASLALVDYRSLWKPGAPATEASAAAAVKPRVSCATVTAGMSEAEVLRRLGEPDRRLADEETRGPGAAVLLYDSSRCAVHVFRGRVELVD